MNKTKPSFVLQAGHGFLHLQGSGTQPDIKGRAELARFKATGKGHRFALWQGDLNVPLLGRVQARATASSRAACYQLAFHRFPENANSTDAWKKVAECKLPLLGELMYVDGTVKFGDRSYALRITKTEKGYMLLRLPQVKSAHTRGAMM
jgi:hypothetical protein